MICEQLAGYKYYDNTLLRNHPIIKGTTKQKTEMIENGTTMLSVRIVDE